MGTVNSGTEVQRQTEMTDQQLEDAFVAALKDAEGKAEALIGSMQNVALNIVALHRSGAWSRVIDSEGKQVYTCASAYYRKLAEPFQKIHKTVRVEIVEQLFNITADETGEIGMPIGVTELAALLKTDKSQVSLTASEEKRKREAEAKQAEAEAEAEALKQAKAEALEKLKADAAAEAQAEAEKQGLSEAEAEAKAAERVALLERMAEAEAEAERKQAEAKAEAEKRAAERKQAEGKIKRAKGALEQALKTASELRPQMTEADQAWLVTLVTRAVASWTGEAEAEAEAEGKQAEAEGKQAEGIVPAAEALAEAVTALVGAPADPTGISAPKPGPASRGRGRGKQAASA